MLHKYVNMWNVGKLCMEFVTLCYAVIYDYMKNSGLHCIKYIVDENIHWTEKLFWIVCCLSSWILCSSQMISTWYESESRPVSVLLETDRMNWNTKFPAVTICQTGTEILTTKINNSNSAAILEEIIFFSGHTTFIKHCLNKSWKKLNVDCPTDDFVGLQKRFLKNCTELLKRCRWNNKDFPCCSTFLLVQTELGICYSSGYLHSTAVRKKSIQMSINAREKAGDFYVDINAPSAKVFIHSWEDIPNHNSLDDLSIEVKKGINYYRKLKIIATENQPDVVNTWIEKRRCRYPHETHGMSSKAFNYYSPGVCLIECREKRMMEFCKCLPHTQPGADTKNICGIRGLLCISYYYTSIYVLSSKFSKDKDNYIQCSCDESCNHVDIHLIDSYNVGRNESSSAGVNIIVPNLPPIRFNRVVVRDELDQVVAVAGLVSLFLGTSLMTILEFFIFVFIRPWTRN